jgi:putative ABC transport system permease protein
LGGGSSNGLVPEGQPRDQEHLIQSSMRLTVPGYLAAMRIPLVRGRDFTSQDVAGAQRVMIVSEALAKRAWPNEDPIGKRIKYGPAESDAPWMTIVGVVGDMRRTGYDTPVRYETFLPLAQNVLPYMTLVVRTAGEPLSLVPAVRAAIRAVDPDQPVYEVKSMDQLLSERVAQRRFSMALLATFAGLALALGLVGVYGVTSYLVAQRTREVGLRIALGAQPGQLIGMVVRQGMAAAALGLAVGLVGALATARLMRGLLYDVAPTDAATLVAVTALLALATLLANYLPARRAAHVDPLVALRNE